MKKRVSSSTNTDISFRERVFSVVSTIPQGSVMTYSEVADRAGNPKASRAVGAIMRTNYNPDIPCHRVVSKTGLGGYNRGVEEKKRKLLNEGVNCNSVKG